MFTNLIILQHEADDSTMFLIIKTKIKENCFLDSKIEHNYLMKSIHNRKCNISNKFIFWISNSVKIKNIKYELKLSYILIKNLFGNYFFPSSAFWNTVCRALRNENV